MFYYFSHLIAYTRNLRLFYFTINETALPPLKWNVTPESTYAQMQS